MYKINRAGAPPVYRRTKDEVYRWQKLNPGECRTWGWVDPTVEMQRLADALGDIASFSEGEYVTNGFDCPVHATNARIALYPEDVT